MTTLSSIIKGLEADEIRYIATGLKTGAAGGEEERLVQKLFGIILNEKKDRPSSDEELSLLIYKTKKSAALAKLKSRLFQLILDQLGSDPMICKEQAFDCSDRQVIRIRKKMLQFRIMYRKKNRADITVLYHLLNEILKGAKEYEQYDVMVEALYFKKYLVMLRKGFDEIKIIREQIAFYEYAHKAVLKANDHYFDLITSQGLIRKPGQGKQQPELQEALRELREFIERTDSVSITYIYKVLCLEELIHAQRYSHTIVTCNSILNLMNKHAVLFRKERMGFIHDNISLCLVYQEDFKNAVGNARRAQQFYQPHSISCLFSKQQEFFACFYGDAFEEAFTVVEQMLAFEMMNKGEFRHDKFLFLKACTLFKMNRVKESLCICNQALKITQDKGRWDLGIRYLRLMCLIKTGDHDAAYHSIDALRKILNRLKEQHHGQELQRDEYIYKAFHELGHAAFRHPGHARLKDLLQQLSAPAGPLAWTYYSHEIIPVHRWIGVFLSEKTTTAKAHT